MSLRPRSIVLNADDAGFGAAGDDLILKALQMGALRSVSLAVTRPHTAREFLSRLNDLELAQPVGIGLHLDLVDTEPIGDSYSTLGAEIGDKDAFWRRAAAGAIDPDEVADEARRQWERLLDWGVRPDHLDGHTHVQLYPTVLEGLVRGLGDEFLHLRFPLPDDPPTEGTPPFPTPLGTEADFAAARARTRWQSPLPFRGFSFSASPSFETLEGLLRCGSSGAFELMIHFGGWADRPFLTSTRRDREFSVVADKSLLDRLEALGVRSCTFGELA